MLRLESNSSNSPGYVRRGRVVASISAQPFTEADPKETLSWIDVGNGNTSGEVLLDAENILARETRQNLHSPKPVRLVALTIAIVLWLSAQRWFPQSSGRIERRRLIACSRIPSASRAMHRRQITRGPLEGGDLSVKGLGLSGDQQRRPHRSGRSAPARGDLASTHMRET
jgi:hypothetical protein